MFAELRTIVALGWVFGSKGHGRFCRIGDVLGGFGMQG